MVGFRVAFAGGVLIAGLLAPCAAARAQTAGEAPSAQVASPAIDTSIIHRELRAGPVRAALTAMPLGRRYLAGASAFVQLTLSSDAKSRRGVTAELMIEGETGEIAGVSGSKVKVTEEDDGRHVARISGLRKGRDRSVLIEVRLRAHEPGAPNRLKITLLPPGEAASREKPSAEDGAAAAGNTVSLAWGVTDCASGYLAALRRIGEEKGTRLRDIWRNAARPEKSVSRNWHFKPVLPKRTARRRKTAPQTAAATGAMQEREIFLEAGRLLRMGYDPLLGSRGRYRMTLSKTSNDLRKYVSQEPNPAICTGAVEFTRYYEGKLAGIGKRGEKLAALSAAAKRLAQAKVAAMVDVARALPEGHPGWGGATLASLRPVRDRSGDLKAAVLDLLQVSGFEEEVIAAVRQAENAYDALAILDDHGLRDAELTRAARADLRQALAAIEAAVRLDMFAARHGVFWDGFNGSLEAIREAHRRNCVCDG